MNTDVSRQTNIAEKAKIWFWACRPFSFTASMVPVFLGAAAAIYLKTPADWLLFPLVVLASLAIHAATNLINDYFDYVKGVDRNETFGSSRLLVEGVLLARHVLAGGIFLFALTAAIGLVFIAFRGLPILIIGLVGILGGFFYTAAPLAYKYRGIGDAMVFLLMGPLMVIGSFLVLTGRYEHFVLWISLPVGFLVAAILSANNLRDIEHDRRAGICTTACLLGRPAARIEYSVLIICAYAAVLIMAILKILPVWSLATLIIAPLGVKNIRSALAAEKPEQIARLDVQTAQFHLVFGVLLIISLIVEGLL